jgi:hypothetical protein
VESLGMNISGCVFPEDSIPSRLADGHMYVCTNRLRVSIICCTFLVNVETHLIQYTEHKIATNDELPCLQNICVRYILGEELN